MTMFIVGPVEMYPETKQVRMKDFSYFRSPEYSEMASQCLTGLSSLLGNDEPNSLIYMASSGTGAMEAAVENCVSEKDKCLVVNGGTFGRRFCELLAYHGKTFSEIDLEWNERLSDRHLLRYENQGYTMLFVNLCETQTGQLYDIELLSSFCRRNGMMLLVDAISTFLADAYDMNKYGIDLTIISSQKGLALSPGAAFVSFSRRMMDKVIQSPAPSSKYFDFKDFLTDVVRGQTPYTPPVFIMYELREMLKRFKKEGGPDTHLAVVKRKAEYFRTEAVNAGFRVPDYPLSNVLTPLYFDDIDAERIVSALRDDCGIYVNPCGGHLAKKMLRVAHIGNTTMEDIDILIEKLLLTVEKIKGRNE